MAERSATNPGLPPFGPGPRSKRQLSVCFALARLSLLVPTELQHTEAYSCISAPFRAQNPLLQFSQWFRVFVRHARPLSGSPSSHPLSHAPSALCLLQRHTHSKRRLSHPALPSTPSSSALLKRVIITQALRRRRLSRRRLALAPSRFCCPSHPALSIGGQPQSRETFSLLEPFARADPYGPLRPRRYRCFPFLRASRLRGSHRHQQPPSRAAFAPDASSTAAGTHFRLPFSLP